MKENTIRILFTVIFSLLATAVSSVMLYILPVLYYAGDGSQATLIITGVLIGALLFSGIGTALTYAFKDASTVGLALSLASAIVFSVFYRTATFHGNTTLFLGSIGSESFSLFFASMYQSYPRPHGSKLLALLSVVIFTMLSVGLFIVTAEIYRGFGQAYLPDIIVYLELILAVLGAISLLYFVASGQKKGAQRKS